jgi:phosphoglycerol geranylgeranyltransferase
MIEDGRPEPGEADTEVPVVEIAWFGNVLIHRLKLNRAWVVKTLQMKAGGVKDGRCKLSALQSEFKNDSQTVVLRVLINSLPGLFLWRNLLSGMKVLEFLRTSKTDRRIHLTSFDPCCHSPKELPKTALRAAEAGTDGFLLGGSTGVDRELVESCTKIIQQTMEENFEAEKRPPLILFPSSAKNALASLADAVLFLSLLNSNSVQYLIREQAMAAPILRMIDLEPVGCGMIMIEPGGTAGRVGKADLLKHDDIDGAVGYACAAEAFGFPLIYLNAGSGCDRPVSREMIAAVAAKIEVPLIVGGGLKTEGLVKGAVEAGADIVITGTAVENCMDVPGVIGGIASAVHSIPPAGAH